MKKELPKILRQSPIQSYKDLRKGFNELTPLDHAYSKRIGHFWGMFGGTAGALSLAFRAPHADSNLSEVSMFGFAFIVGSFAWLQFVEWRKEDQKINELKKMKEEIKRMEAQNDTVLS